MRRYIDAYALENRVEDFEKLTGMKLDIVHDFVSSQPTVDVVEVVRCKDCKWWGYLDDKGPVRVCHAAKHGYKSKNWDIGIYRTYNEDFYCADGERA